MMDSTSMFYEQLRRIAPNLPQTGVLALTLRLKGGEAVPHLSLQMMVTPKPKEMPPIVEKRFVLVEESEWLAIQAQLPAPYEMEIDPN